MEPLSFEGIKFWISKHVPPLIKLDVRKRKGEIVVLERDANICLVDHNEYVADPDRFYSYLWVKECLSKNARVDESRFLVAELRKSMPAASQTPAYAASRDVAPSSCSAYDTIQARKRTRTGFTNEDDRILVEWLREKADFSEGAKNGVKGNEIYKDLARQYPHHTFHSWRDRWVKKLSKIVEHDYVTKGKASRRVQQSLQAPVEPTSRRTVSAPVAAPNAPPPLTHDERVPFLSSIDMAIMRGTWKESRTGENKTQAAFFRSLAVQYPKVSIEQWEARYKRLRAWYEKVDTFDLEEDRLSERPSTAVDPPAMTNAASGDNQAIAASHDHNDNDGNDRNGDQSGDEDEDVEDGDVDFDASALLEEVSAQDGAQKQFLGFVDFFNANGGGYYIPRAFVIGGRLLDIWTLWTTVQDVTPDPKTRDWGRVARALSFDTAKHPAVQHELEIWYAHNMAEFEEARAEFEADEQADGPEAVIPSTQTELSAGAKRRLVEAFGGDGDEGEDEDENADGTSARTPIRSHDRKRAALASEVELPSDEEDDSAFERRSSAPAKTEAGRRKTVEPETQDFSYDQARNEDADEEDEDEGEDGGSRPGLQVTPLNRLPSAVGTIEAVPLSLPRRADSTGGTAVRESPSASASASAATPAPQASNRRSLPGWLTRSQAPIAQMMTSPEQPDTVRR
ncbi:transcription factor [Grosmannia clavigera kw1407]|uniref:DNA-binding protein RAP1 n=1 Tax=Grosmannia clavigera (strain kw1407 / UAMH 11150) TaxID=655863 RepID=F0X9T9_GROCL|nr:transcription factor [Grosmannia clavigera kw1407]EFX06155.1 transcription factor [Grosmannia clavigera kw1407]